MAFEHTPSLRLFVSLMLFVSAASGRTAQAQGNASAAPPPVRTKKEMVALFTQSPIRLDALLDEPVWKEAQPATGFTQREPMEGAKDSEGTDIRAAYDREALYLGVWAFDREPDKIVINDLIQDFPHTNSDMV